MKLIELAQAFEDGKTVQVAPEHTPPGMGYRVTGDKWVDTVGHQHALKYWMNNSDSVRIKPELKPIDLSVLIQSGIDCEFLDENSRTWYIAGALHSLDGKPLCYYNALHRESYKCRPRMNHWHSWQGGECPLPEGFLVELRFRDGNELKSGYYSDITCIRWSQDNHESDIIAFKVIGTADTHCMPWDVES